MSWNDSVWPMISARRKNLPFCHDVHGYIYVYIDNNGWLRILVAYCSFIP